MYLGGNTEIKTSQLKGKDDYLNDIYYYHPSVKVLWNIQIFYVMI